MLASLTASGGPQNHSKVITVICGRNQQRGASRAGQLERPLRERPLESRRERQRLRQRTDRVGSSRSKCSGQLDKREGVPLRLHEQPLAHARSEVRSMLIEKCGRRFLVQRLEPQLGKARLPERARPALADGGQQGDRLETYATRHERQHVRGRAVQPVGVLGDHQDGSACGRVREQLQRRQCDEEQLGSGGGGLAEGRAQGLALWRRKLRHVGEQRLQKLVQARKRQLSFREHARRRQDDHAASTRASSRCRKHG